MASQHISAYLLMTGLILLALSTGTPLPEKLNNQMNYAAAMHSKDLEGKIINGYFPALENVKHQVSLRLNFKEKQLFGNGHICGGSLIKPQVVLSAATCFLNFTEYADLSKVPFRDSSEFMVAMGNVDRFNSSNVHYTGLLKVVMPTETFDLNTYDQNIALLFLKNPVPPHLKHIQPIELNNQPVRDGTMCTVSGWGINYMDAYLMNLLSVDVPFISQMTCIKDSDFYGWLGPGKICAGYIQEGQKVACDGYLGGPLVCNGLLTGIFSYAECEKPGLPGVYTDVLNHHSWIEHSVVAQMDAIHRNNAPRRLNYGVIYLFLLVCLYTSYH